MKKLLYVSFLMFLFFGQSISAQKNLVGSYHVSSGNPDDGGYSWFLFENNEFAMLTFGQIVSGKWLVNKNNEIEFTPYAPTESFQVFGRYDPKIKGTRLMFRGLDINESSYMATSDKEIQPLLNDEANCLPFPILKTFETPIEKLIFSKLLTENSGFNQDGLQFEMLNNNDFIVVYYDSQNKISPFKGKIFNEELSINYGSSSPKQSISETDAMEIKPYIEQQKNFYAQESMLSTKEYRFGNISTEGNIIFSRNQFAKEDFTFDATTGTYTLKKPFDNEGQLEYNTLFLYKKLNFKTTTEPLKVNNKSVFTYGCE